MKYLLLLLIPIALLVNISYNNKTEFGQDPNYCYLFNAMNLASQCGPVGMYAHPGTTVVELSAVIMKISHSLRKTDNDLTTDVLISPQYYIKIIVRTFGVINSILIFLIGFFILRMTNELVYGLLFQTIPAFSKSVIWWSFETISPEPVLLGAVILFVILFLWKYYFNKSFGIINLKIFENRQISVDKFPILFGILMGFCLATKINTLPLLLLPLLLIPKILDKFIFSVITFFAFLIFTLPIAHLYRIMISWYKGVLFHTDIYGAGKAGFIDPDLFFKNFLVTIKSEHIILSIISISVLVLIKQIVQKKFDIHFKILASFVLVQIADLFMVLKHFNLHYFIPILPTLAVNIFIIFRMFEFSRLWKLILILPFILICFYFNKDFKKRIPSLYQTEFPADGINVFSYKSTSPMYALKFGEDQSRNANSEKLKNIYGDQYFYDIWNKIFITWNDTLTLDSLFRVKQKVYLHALDVYMKELPPPFEIRFISEGLYLIENQKSDSLTVE